MTNAVPIVTNERGEITSAQLRVLHALSRESKYAAVAISLNMSSRTVEQHVVALKKVTKHKNLFQLGMWYQRHYPDGDRS